MLVVVFTFSLVKYNEIQHEPTYGVSFGTTLELEAVQTGGSSMLLQWKA